MLAFASRSVSVSRSLVRLFAMSSGSSDSSTPTFAMDAFCLRQFLHEEEDGTVRGIIEESPEMVEARINTLFKEEHLSLSDGYAPFCKVRAGDIDSFFLFTFC